MRKLVIHADDFGLSESVNQAILLGMCTGRMTSTSLLVNFPSSSEALQMAKENKLDVGWHMNLTEGLPLSPPKKIPSLVQSGGSFHPLPSFLKRILLKQINPLEIEEELETQWNFFLSAKILPSHLDGHQHIQVFSPICDVVKKRLPTWKIPFIRAPSEKGGLFSSRLLARTFLRLFPASRSNFWNGSGARTIPFYGLSLGKQGGQLSSWKRVLQRISSEIAEIMVHPALSTSSSLADSNRERQWNLLISSEFKSLIQNMGFQLVCFRDL